MLDNMEFDENEAIKYMRANVDPGISARYTDDDELFNLIDLVYDYYEANGLLDVDLDGDDDDEVDFDDLMEYVGRMLRKDKGSKMDAGDAAAFIHAYFDYEDSLD